MHVWHPSFVAAAQGIPHEGMALVASEIYVHGSHRTATNKQKLLNQLPLPLPWHSIEAAY